LFSILIKINSKEMFMLLLFRLESFKDWAWAWLAQFVLLIYQLCFPIVFNRK
jgi:hypothetical protein